jgi:murein DD-endopeptidase MepM/ murein hydrolase activator NlpD
MKNFIFFLICLQFIAYSQELQLFGTAQPGNAMIGKADNILQVMLNDEKLKIDDNGVFIFGFDRDAKGTYLLKVKYKDGKSEIKKFDLPERKYDIQKINSTKKQFSSPPEEELPRIERERQLMREARAKIGIDDSAYFASGFTRPVKGGRIVGVFGSQRILNGVPKNIHNGIDISAPTGRRKFLLQRYICFN